MRRLLLEESGTGLPDAGHARIPRPDQGAQAPRAAAQVYKARIPRQPRCLGGIDGHA